MMTLREITLLTGLVAFALHSFFGTGGLPPKENLVRESTAENLQLGAFSVSLTVKDIKASMEFYEKLGFKQAGGEAGKNWVIMRNGDTTIGLFHGLFEKNIMTFNPGWDAQAKPIKKFADVRDLQSELKKRGVKLVKPIDEAAMKTNQPASFVITDPDDNMILIDQHVAKPETP